MFKKSVGIGLVSTILPRDTSDGKEEAVTNVVHGNLVAYFGISVSGVTVFRGEDLVEGLFGFCF